jgi:hypothetical protein
MPMGMPRTDVIRAHRPQWKPARAPGGKAGVAWGSMEPPSSR